MAESRLQAAFVGAFAACLEPGTRTHLQVPCDLMVVDESDIIARLPDLDVLVTIAFTPAMGTAAQRLKLIQVPGAGIDRIDRSAVPPGAHLANVYGHETGIAEFAIGVMLAWTRDFGRLDANLRQGNWSGLWDTTTVPPTPWAELSGKTLGILGYGRIGQGVARLARAFGMNIWAIRRDPSRSDATELAFLGGPDDLDEVLRRADYLVVALSLDETTRGLIGERELRVMKPTAVLVNVARGEIVDEAALYQALARRTIAGAAIDVWYQYPRGSGGPVLPSRQPFHELPNVLMTPHVSGWSEGTLDARARLIAENISRIARDEPPLNLIPPL